MKTKPKKEEKKRKLTRKVILIDESPTYQLPREKDKKTVKVEITEPSRASYTTYVNMEQSEIDKLDKKENTEE